MDLLRAILPCIEWTHIEQSRLQSQYLLKARKAIPTEYQAFASMADLYPHDIHHLLKHTQVIHLYLNKIIPSVLRHMGLWVLARCFRLLGVTVPGFL